MKLAFALSKEKNHILHLAIFKYDDESLHTILYRKPTDRNAIQTIFIQAGLKKTIFNNFVEYVNYKYILKLNLMKYRNFRKYSRIPKSQKNRMDKNLHLQNRAK